MSVARNPVKSTIIPAVLLYMMASPAFAFAVAVPEPDALVLLAGGVVAALVARKFGGRK